MRLIDKWNRDLLLQTWIAHPESGRMWSPDYNVYLADEVVRRRLGMYSHGRLSNPLPDNWLIVHEDVHDALVEAIVAVHSHFGQAVESGGM